MMNSQVIFLISAGCIFGGAMLGLLLSGLLPEQHLRDTSRETVKVVTGMIATLAALVLGLLISSANGTAEFVIRLQALNQNVEVRLGIVHEQNSAVRKFFHGACASRK